MRKEEMQALLNQKEHTAAEMRSIGEAYLHGDVLYDPIAAEAWLMKAVEMEDMMESPKAMALLVEEIMGKKQVISKQDYQDIKRDWEQAKGQEKEYLECLLRLV